MRILHILDHSIPLQSGYAFRTLSILSEQRARGWQTVHLTSPKHTLPYRPEEDVDGWHFYRTPSIGRAARSLPILRELALMNVLSRRLEQVVAETKPDILHAHSPVLNALPALRVGRARRLPVVYEVRSFWEDAAVSHGQGRERGPRYLLSRAVETYALKRAQAVTVICEGLRQDLLSRGIAREKITVIPNAVDPAEFVLPQRDPALAEQLGLTDKTVLGFIGSFYSYEGLHLLIEALPAIMRSISNARLLLVGGGPEDQRLRALAARLGLAHAVVFTGRVPHADVLRYYALVDALIFPRLAIRLTDLVTPLKPLEAMALGKVVIASDVGGHRELIRDGETGSLFQAEDTGDLVRTVVSVLSTREAWPHQLAAGRRYVELERNWASSVARYEEVYRRLVE
jgi:PEP-CTERM/exosortase A-associated glycosyltransferase